MGESLPLVEITKGLRVLTELLDPPPVGLTANLPEEAYSIEFLKHFSQTPSSWFEQVQAAAKQVTVTRAMVTDDLLPANLLGAIQRLGQAFKELHSYVIETWSGYTQCINEYGSREGRAHANECLPGMALDIRSRIEDLAEAVRACGNCLSSPVQARVILDAKDAKCTHARLKYGGKEYTVTPKQADLIWELGQKGETNSFDKRLVWGSPEKPGIRERCPDVARIITLAQGTTNQNAGKLQSNDLHFQVQGDWFSKREDLRRKNES